MTKLYVLDLNRLSGDRWRDLLPLLPPERRKRAEGCRFEADRIRIAGSGWLLQYGLEQAGIPAPQQRIVKNDWGKPHLAEQEDVFFNLSHSGNWAVCAVSDRPVGVDVELPRCSIAIARRHFRPEEVERLEALPWQAQKEELNRLWTAKEAFSKAIGRGLTVAMDRFGVCLSASGAVLQQSLSELPYVLHEYVLHPCRMCLCCVGERPEPEIVEP